MDTNIVNIRFFDKDINFLGEVDNYTSLFYVSKWETYGEFEFHLSSFNKNLIQKGNIIMMGNDSNKSGVIEHIEISQEDTEDIVVKGFSLGYWFTNRIAIPPIDTAYHSFNTTVEDIMISLVNINVVSPLDINRKIPNLTLETSMNRGIQLEFQTRYKYLSDELTKLSKASGLGWTITLDYKAKKFIFKVLEGKILTTEQNINPPQIFSIDYDNIRKQTYIESNIGYKNMAYVAGQGEGENREIDFLNSDLSGFDRRETFIDARDISEGGNLLDRAKIKLSETPKINSFECEVEPREYKSNWNLGDIVTTLNKKNNLIKHNRVIEIKETWESGYKIEPTLGTPIPTIIEKLKQNTDTPLQESTQGSKGETGATGERGASGYSMQYHWNGTSLGIKREDENTYNYVDLKGIQGTIGPKGDSGTQGLQGHKGDTGSEGPRGLTGAQGVKGDNGITPTIGLNGNWFIGTQDTGKPSRGIQGERGLQGMPGTTDYNNLINKPTRLSQFQNDLNLNNQGTATIVSDTQPSGHINGRVWINTI